MPELPEVETVRAGLEPAVTGALIHGVDVREPRSLRRHDERQGSLTGLLEGRRISGAVRRGKFLWFPLSSGLALVAHLGMSGQLLLRSAGSAAARSLRVRLELEHPQHGEFAVDFVDQRIFGWLMVDTLAPTPDGMPGGFAAGAASGAEWERMLPVAAAHIARDPLDPAFSDDAFHHALARKRTGIKRALLDQTLVSGVGNIYADEALWAARIHYDQATASFTRVRTRRLLGELRKVLLKALAEGGTSFDSQYVNVNGASGYFAHSLNAYGQQGNPCPRCGRTIVRERFANRSSHFCPRCQRLSGARTRSR